MPCMASGLVQRVTQPEGSPSAARSPMRHWRKQRPEHLASPRPGAGMDARSLQASRRCRDPGLGGFLRTARLSAAGDRDRVLDAERSGGTASSCSSRWRRSVGGRSSPGWLKPALADIDGGGSSAAGSRSGVVSGVGAACRRSPKYAYLAAQPTSIADCCDAQERTERAVDADRRRHADGPAVPQLLAARAARRRAAGE